MFHSSELNSRGVQIQIMTKKSKESIKEISAEPQEFVPEADQEAEGAPIPLQPRCSLPILKS